MSGRGLRTRLARAVLAALATIVVAAPGARAGYESAGTTAANFLSLGSGARALAMGGAVLGLGDDTGGAAWNPAALGWVERTELALSHASLPDGRLQEWGGAGGRIGSSRTRWGVSGLYQGEGALEGRDAAGAPTGPLSVSSMALGATLAQSLGPATLGLAAKGVREDIAGISGSGVTFDAGLMARAGGFGLGLAAQNVGGRMRYGASSYPFPTSFGAGLGYTRPALGLRIGLDANVPSDYHADLRLGAEWIHRGAFAMRAGYRKELGSADDPLDGPSFGVGASHHGWWLDYGYLLSSLGSGQHRLGLRFRLGGSPPAAPEGAEIRREAGEFDWARDGTRLGPGKPPETRKP
jgi:hypothetical protein